MAVEGEGEGEGGLNSKHDTVKDADIIRLIMIGA